MLLNSSSSREPTVRSVFTISSVSASESSPSLSASQSMKHSRKCFTSSLEKPVCLIAAVSFWKRKASCISRSRTIKRRKSSKSKPPEAFSMASSRVFSSSHRVTGWRESTGRSLSMNRLTSLTCVTAGPPRAHHLNCAVRSRISSAVKPPFARQVALVALDKQFVTYVKSAKLNWSFGFSSSTTLRTGKSGASSRLRLSSNSITSFLGTSPFPLAFDAKAPCTAKFSSSRHMRTNFRVSG
mmetsp:Transcript_18860/g.59241  ORF Transcript_18860/g.59241 Transcript_18860/m.59241 type:complete len:240 (-) Transcript_18860:1433-2152(-)